LIVSYCITGKESVGLELKINTTISQYKHCGTKNRLGQTEFVQCLPCTRTKDFQKLLQEESATPEQTCLALCVSFVRCCRLPVKTHLQNKANDHHYGF